MEKMKMFSRFNKVSIQFFFFVLIKSEVILFWPDAIKLALKRDWTLPKKNIWKRRTDSVAGF